MTFRLMSYRNFRIFSSDQTQKKFRGNSNCCAPNVKTLWTVKSIAFQNAARKLKSADVNYLKFTVPEKPVSQVTFKDSCQVLKFEWIMLFLIALFSEYIIEWWKWQWLLFNVTKYSFILLCKKAVEAKARVRRYSSSWILEYFREREKLCLWFITVTTGISLQNTMQCSALFLLWYWNVLWKRSALSRLPCGFPFVVDFSRV